MRKSILEEPLVKRDALILLGTILLTSLILAFSQHLYEIKRMPIVNSVDVETQVGCKSNSMGLTIKCGDKIYGEYIEKDEVLVPGDIYVYDKSENGTAQVVHRLVLCLDDDCNSTVFKGDNNVVAEVVNRSDILYRVIMKTT